MQRVYPLVTFVIQISKTVQNEKLEIRLFENGVVVLGLATSHCSQNDAKRVQVRPGDQPGYPKDTIESFVGHSSMGLLCPPAVIGKISETKIATDVKEENHRSKFIKQVRSFTSFQMIHTHTPIHTQSVNKRLGKDSWMNAKYSSNQPRSIFLLVLQALVTFLGCQISLQPSRTS